MFGGFAGDLCFSEESRGEKVCFEGIGQNRTAQSDFF